jgi:hypothetical protein
MLPSLLVPTLTGVAVVASGVAVVASGVAVVETGVAVVETGVDVVETGVVLVLEAQLGIGLLSESYQVVPSKENPDVVPSVHLT